MKAIVTTIFLLAMQSTMAQLDRRPVTLGAGLEVGVPVGEFNDTFGKEIYGLGANLTVPMSILPFDWGFKFGWGHMGAESQEVPVDEEFVEATTGELRVSSDIFGYHGLLRLKPFNGKVSPYIEGLIGLRQFTTRTKIDVEGLDEPLFEQRNANEFIWSHGWAAGIQVAPTKVFYVEARAERLNGDKISYVDPGSIEISPDGVVTYQTLNSGVRTLNFLLGIGLRF